MTKNIIKHLHKNDKVIQLCNKYNINFSYKDINTYATGIGDILLRLVCIKNNIFNKTFYINLSSFTKEYYMSDPINQLEFRFQLIKDIIKYNNLPNNTVEYVFSNINNPKGILCAKQYNKYDMYLPYDLIKNYNLEITNDKNEISNQYIIFHTKCRHLKTENYTNLKNNIKIFCKKI
jgi:hypothetical protein